LKGYKEQYSCLFALLKNEPRYWDALSSVVSLKESVLFVQTVVFDLFGDQYETREEKLLLSIFQLVLKREVKKTRDLSSFLRSNSVVTQMLSAYARRGIGISVLKDALGATISRIVADSELNLEVNPIKVYEQMIHEHESKSSTPWPEPKDLTLAQLGKHEKTQAVINSRSKLIEEFAQELLDRISISPESTPYGIRWICKQLRILCEQAFPDAPRKKIGSIVGGFIFLRFFVPATLSPETWKLSSGEISRTTRRNLVLVSKLLQNLSNCHLFGDKETYMVRFNDFVLRNQGSILNYFDELVAVEHLEEEFDSLHDFEALTKCRSSVVNLSLNQVFLIHQLCQKNLNIVAPEPGDPLREILVSLGESSCLLSVEENEIVSLTLESKKDGKTLGILIVMNLSLTSTQKRKKPELVGQESPVPRLKDCSKS